MSRIDAADLAQRLGRQAEAVCRTYLSNGRRQGNYVSGVCIPLRFAVSDLEPSGDFSSEVSEGCRHGGWRGWICWAV